MIHARLRPALLAVVTVAVLASAPGCSGRGGPSSRVTSEFTSEDAVLFDDGVDFISGGAALQGHWKQGWVDELTRRVERADAIAAVRVQTVVTEVSPQGQDGYQLTVDVEETLEGELPDEASLHTSPTSRGYRTVHAHTQNVEAGRFLLFVKWALGDDESQVIRWHLAPDSDDVRAAVAERVKPKGPPEMVITERPLEE